MDELEKLIEQKKEIERKIKELKNREVTVGQTRLSYSGVRKGCSIEPVWSVDILTFTDYPKEYKPAWRKVIIQKDRDTAIGDLENLISDLTVLHELLTGKVKRGTGRTKYKKYKPEPDYNNAVFNGETDGC